MRKKKAVVAGHICLDITPVFPGNISGKGKRVDDILSPGSLLHMDGVTIGTGGAVANTGIAMKIMGADVQLMGKIGDDAFGKSVLSVLEKYEVSAEGMIVSEDVDTSYTVVVAIPGIDRIFLHDPGANDSFSSDDINYDKLQNTDLFHFGYPTLMDKMYSDDGVQLVRMLKKVKEQGTAVSLDLAAVDPNSKAGTADWKKILTAALPYVDLFVPSAEELCYMLEPALFESWKEQTKDGDITDILDMEAVKPLGHKCLELGAKIVIVKCGAKGIYYCTADDEEMQNLCQKLELDPAAWVAKEGFEYSYVPEAVRSATGAGDTCIAAFLTAILNGEALEEAMHLAAAAGACCVASYDALSGLCSMDEMKEKIQQGWAKQI